MKTILGIIFLLSSVLLIAQDCESYYPVTEGTVIEMKSYNEKDKLTGSVVQKILKKEGGGDAIKLTVNTQAFDDDGKSLNEGEIVIRCEKGIFYMDMRNFLDPKQFAGFEGSDMELEINASDMEYPSGLSVGQALKDANISVKVKTGGMTMMNMNILIFNRKVEAEEDITTPAGTFTCYKISSEMETNVMFKVISKSIEWIALDAGVVRSETYDKKGKLQGYNLLTKLK